MDYSRNISTNYITALSFLHSTDRPSLALWTGCGHSCADCGSGSGVHTVASGVGGCCRRQVCLLNYIINVILIHRGHRVHRAFLHFSVISVPSVACIKMLSSPHSFLRTPAAGHSPLTCATLPPLACLPNRQR